MKDIKIFLTGMLLDISEVGIFLGGIVTVAGFAGSLHWALDLCCHFRIQYFFICLICSIILLTGKRKKFAIAGAIVVALNFIACIPVISPTTSNNIPENSVKLKVISHNINTANTNYQSVISQVNEYNPDIVFLTEISSQWVKELTVLKEKYPYTIAEPQEDNFGFMLFSKYDFSESEIKNFSTVPSVYVKIKNEVEFNFIGTHPLPPAGGKEYCRERDSHLVKLSEFVNTLQEPVIVAGDFNTTPFSSSMRRLLKNSKLHMAKNILLNPTWGRNTILFFLPLDYILFSNDITLNKYKVGKSAGSDHNMIYAELYLNKAN